MRFTVFSVALLSAGLLATSTFGSDNAALLPETELERRIVAGPTADDVAEYALRRAPMVKAAKASARAAVERIRVETGWADPSLMLEGMYMTETLGDRGAPDEWKMTLSQTIPLPGRRSTAGEAAKADARIARFKVDAAMRDTALAARESFFELSYLAEARKAAVGSRELLESLSAAGDAAYASGKAGLYDVAKAKAQSGQAAFDAVVVEELWRTEVAKLNALLDRAPDAPVGVPRLSGDRSIGKSLEAVSTLALENLAEVRSAKAAVDKAEAMRSLARYENLPELSVGAIYAKNSGVASVGGQLGLSLPIFGDKKAGRTGAAAADRDAMKAESDARRNEATTAVREAWFAYGNSDRLVSLYRDDLLPQAERGIEAADLLFRSGNGSFSNVTESHSALYQFRLALVRALADRGKALARLESLAGVTLTVADGTSTAEGSGVTGVASSTNAAASSSAAAVVPESLPFLVPDPARLARLAKAENDPKVAEAVLSADGFTLADVETLALLRAPSIATKERELRAVLDGYAQTESIEATLNAYKTSTAASMAPVGPADSPQQMAQVSFPFPGIGALKGDVVAFDAKAAQARVDAAKRDAVVAARSAFRDLAYKRAAADVAASAASLLEGVRASVFSRYESGGGSQAETMRTAAMSETAREEAATARAEATNAEATLRAALALPEEAKVGRPASEEGVAAISASVDGLAKAALAQRPELRAMRAEVAKMERMVEMLETMTRPGFTLGLSRYERNDISRGGVGMGANKADAQGRASAAGGRTPGAAQASFPTSTGASVGVGAPVGSFYGAKEAYLAETRNRLGAARAALAAEEAALPASVSDAWTKADTARRDAALYRDRLTTLADAGFDAALAAYSAGKGPLEAVLTGARDRLDASIGAARKEAEARNALSAFEAVVGVSPLPTVKDGETTNQGGAR